MKNKLNLLSLIVLCLGTSSLHAQERIPVNSADELPRITYEVPAVPSQLLLQPEAFDTLLGQVERDLESILSRYEIKDQATLRGFLVDQRNVTMLRGAYDQALSLNRQVREMQEKPADRLTSGLSVDAMLEVIGMGLKPGSEAYASAFKSNYAAKVEALPWAVVQDTLKSSKGSLEMYSENLLMGIIQAQMDPGVGVSGQLDFGAATAVVRFRHMLDYVLPLKDVTVEVLAAYIAANQVEKPDIWAERDVDLSGAKGLNEVVVAIWDSGVDMDIFVPKGKAWINSSDIPGDGIDNDGNGWVDDVHGFAHDLESRKSNDSLYPLPEDILVRYDSLIDMSKGLSDLQASVDSEEAAAFKRKMASLAPEEVEPFLLDLGYFGNYTHGTHVAGIAAAGNPAIRILNARISFDHKVIPDVPTLDGSLRSVRAARESIAYFKQAGVRVVNMSWGGTQAGIEAAFEANGVGDDAQMRAEMARIHFELYYDALVELMASAPEILFIPAAGNSDGDVEFNKVIPSSMALPNVLVAGAVDQAGEETSFTSFGKNVRVHANGFEVESYLPGGKRQKFSGTSMSAPNVANLAAKLLAIDPTLSPTDLISLITLGAETSEDGRRHLIHPRKSLQMLLLRNGMELNGL